MKIDDRSIAYALIANGVQITLAMTTILLLLS